MSLPLFTSSIDNIDYYGLFNTFKDQNFIISFLHPNNPYRSLVICYKVGSGKTYAAACLTHIYSSMGFKTLYLSNSLTSITNFNAEYGKVIADSRFTSLSKSLTTVTFNKFHRQKTTDKYGLIIIDEAHNLRESGIRYKSIKKRLDEMVDSKILIISATPMIDSTNELDTILNLANENTPIAFSSNNICHNLKVNYIGEKVGKETLFLSKLKGKQLSDYNEIIKYEKDAVYTNTRQAAISWNRAFNKEEKIEEQSSKMAKLFETLEDGKLTLILCFYVKRGINFVAKSLESIGYTKWDYYNPIKGKTNYAIINGKTSSNQSEEILKVFNSISNINGEHIKILIGSSVLSESVTINRVRKLHILSPFWNYGQIQQSIGRTIRIGSHSGLSLDKRSIDIYLHAAYVDVVNGEYLGKDIDMWNIALTKKDKIDERLEQELIKDITKDGFNSNDFNIPAVDNKLIFKFNEWVWDLSQCFEHNKFKISWCRIYLDRAVGYDTLNKMKIIGHPPSYIKINEPLDDGYTIWRSCIDNNLRLSYINISKNKFTKRGRLVNNVNVEYINKIAEDIGCENTLNSIIDTLKQQGRYFDKQIEYDL